jgi:hypothetical protein
MIVYGLLRAAALARRTGDDLHVFNLPATCNF